MSSLKNLDDTVNFGDQFLHDQPTEDDQEKSKAREESDSTIPDPSHQTVTSTLLIVLHKCTSPEHHYWVLETTHADLIEKILCVSLSPGLVKNQESEKTPKEIIKDKRKQDEEIQDSNLLISVN
ncbi:hypothetical protein Tco_0206569 [Tanacetum coccineum]